MTHFFSVIKAWNTHDYPKVVELSQTFNKESNVYIRAQEMQGHAYFKMKNFEKAEKIFDNITQNDSGVLAEDAEWYRFLALVASGKKNEASTILKKILADPQHRKYNDALRFSF